MSKENPLVHEIHVSEIREFKKCRFAHKLKFGHRYYPKTTAKALEFGTAYHAGMETYYDPETWSFPNDVKRDLAIAQFVKTCQEQMNALENLDPEKKADYDERIVLGANMLEYYFGVLAPMLDVNLEPLYVEKSFSIPILHPETNEPLMCKCDRCFDKWLPTQNLQDDSGQITHSTQADIWNEDIRKNWDGLPVHLEGKIDLILKDKRTNKVWILDWKTTGRIEENHEWLELDEQIINYLLALHFLGADVAGFYYHQSLKAYPKPPERMSRKYQGKLYSVNRDQDTDYDMYLETVSNGDPEAYNAGLYDDFLQFLENSGKEFYHRETIRKDARHLKLAQFDLYATAQEMTNPNLIIYPSPGKFNCTYCDFEQVCIGRAQLADYEYTLQTQFEQKAPYYER